MSIEETRRGAFHKSLEEEINRVIAELEKIGISNPSKIEASALIAERSRQLTMTTSQIKNFIRGFRGC